MIIKEKDGITTVFVILLMVVLLMFGIGVLTITLSNKNLSDKKHEWIHNYYALEGQMSEELSQVHLNLRAYLKSLDDSEDLEADYLDLIKNRYDVIEENGQYYLTLQVRNQSLQYLEVKIKLMLPSIEETDQATFEIVSYKEMQEFFDYEEIPFENPFQP